MASRDVEWAWAEGRLWLLQARPITTVTARDRENARQCEIGRLRLLADPRGTAWARYNLAEVLPRPTPLCWSIVSRFMSGSGGLGLMFRDLGFDPDPALEDVGYLDLVCGQPLVNLSRERRMHFQGFPYGYPLAEFKQHPERALYPQPVPDSSQVTLGFLLRLPGYIWKMLRAGRKIRQWSDTLARAIAAEIFPRFLAEARTAEQEGLASLTATQLLARAEAWRCRTLNDFARDSLKAAPLAGQAMAAMEGMLAASLEGSRRQRGAGPLVGDRRLEPSGANATTSAERAATAAADGDLAGRSAHWRPAGSPSRTFWPSSAIAGRTKWNWPSRAGANGPKRSPRRAPVRCPLRGHQAALGLHPRRLPPMDLSRRRSAAAGWPARCGSARPRAAS